MSWPQRPWNQRCLWTDAQCWLLRELWNQGASAATIARELGNGVNRDQVIGKAHRLKLPARATPIVRMGET